MDAENKYQKNFFFPINSVVLRNKRTFKEAYEFTFVSYKLIGDIVIILEFTLTDRKPSKQYVYVVAR